MKGKTRLKIFEFLENAAQTAEDVLFIFSLPYGTPFLKMQNLLDKRHASLDRERSHKDIDKQARLRFSDFLCRLKKAGLIAEAHNGGNKLFKLTGKGKKELQKLRSSDLPVCDYKNINEDNLKIIIFDIPEKERRKRVWLRCALINLGFRMLQKSVWLGKTGLPAQFIKDLYKINILSYVEIFAITRQGSLKQIIEKD